jgi:hypothetical protein
MKLYSSHRADPFLACEHDGCWSLETVVEVMILEARDETRGERERRGDNEAQLGCVMGEVTTPWER